MSASETTLGAIRGPARSAPAERTFPITLLIVGAITAIGFAIRVALLDQSLFGDELSTYWVVADHTRP